MVFVCFLWASFSKASFSLSTSNFVGWILHLMIFTKDASHLIQVRGQRGSNYSTSSSRRNPNSSQVSGETPCINPTLGQLQRCPKHLARCHLRLLLSQQRSNSSTLSLSWKLLTPSLSIHRCVKLDFSTSVSSESCSWHVLCVPC